MTLEERARELLAQHGLEVMGGTLAYRANANTGDAVIAAMIAFAAEERERCARVADKAGEKANEYYAAKIGGESGMGRNEARYRTACNIATAIRNQDQGQ